MSSCKECQHVVSIEEMILIQKRKVIAMNKSYVEGLKRALKTLEELRDKKDKDRLDYTFVLVSLISIMKSSVTGWIKWCNIERMHDIFETKEEIKNLIEKMDEIVVQWVKMDIDITNNCIKKMERETIKDAIKSKKKKKQKSKAETKPTMYVA